MITTLSAATRLMPHLFALAISMIYAWHVSQSGFVKTGLQFTAPLLVILISHFIYAAFQGRLVAGYAGLLLRRSLQTTLLLFVAIFLSEILSPTPSQANAGQLADQILSVLFCLVVLAAVIAVAAGILYGAYLILAALFRLLVGGGKDDRLNDMASIAVAASVLAGASLEGVPGAYTFKGDGHSTASYPVAATLEEVWSAMQTATSPEFPLPDALDMFPRPVAVLIDEGTVLGANRVVLIKGREGEGRLHLKVTAQTDRQAVFTVLSDSSPTGRWVAFKSLTYTIKDDPAGARLEVRLDYERLLAPSWIFSPMVESAAHLAASVLARDTKERAEARG